MAATGVNFERGEPSRAREAESDDEEPPATPSNGRSEPLSAAELSKSQLRAIRSGYRNLQTVISDEREKLVRDGATFDTLVNQVNFLFGKVERPREQMADLDTIGELSSSLLEYARKFQERTGPTAADLVAAVLDKYSTGDASQVNWVALGVDSMSFLRDVSGLNTMIGPMSIEPKMKKRNGGGRHKEKLGPTTSPEDVAAAGNQNTETDKNIEALFKILRVKKRVRFEALVLNRRSFSQTVENIFALSFLVKDGRVEISIDADGIHHVVPKNAPTADDRANGNVQNTQFVLRLDFQDWITMKQQLEEGQELMPDRAAAGVPASATPIRKTSRNRARETAASEAQEDEDDDGGGGFRSSKRSRRSSQAD